MKKLIILLFTILFYGCKNDSKELESLEIMSYYYVPNYETKKQELDFLLYSIVDSDGNAKVLKKINPMSKYYSLYEVKIQQNLIDKLSKDNLNKDEDFYNKHKEIKEPNEIYCGPIKRVNLKYKNRHEFSFVFTFDENKKMIDFAALLKILEKSVKLSKGETKSIKKLQKEYLLFSMKKDTTMMALPPFPKLKINEVKFKKNLK